MIDNTLAAQKRFADAQKAARKASGSLRSSPEVREIAKEADKVRGCYSAQVIDILNKSSAAVEKIGRKRRPAVAAGANEASATAANPRQNRTKSFGETNRPYCRAPACLLSERGRGRGLPFGRVAWETAMAARNGAIKLVAGNSNPQLAQAIAAYLKIPLTKAVVRRFADMEIFVEIQENVRGADTFIIQSTSFPANDHLMELLIITDALRRSSASRITAVIPYFGYARQDRKPGPRTPISAKLVANLITHAGANRVLTLDLHAGQIQGFFDIPTDNLFASPVMVRDIKERFDLAKLMVVSPDVGGVVRARGLAKRINAPLAIIDKRRERAGESEVMNVIGEVRGHTCILVDDIVDSGGTLVNAADALLKDGATDVYAYITHGVLSGGAVARITGSRLKELVITDSIQPTEAVRGASNIRVLPIASLIGEAIARTAKEESVSSLFRLIPRTLAGFRVNVRRNAVDDDFSTVARITAILQRLRPTKGAVAALTPGGYIRIAK